MFKLTKVGIATALGLALCLSLFATGAFAQSASASQATGTSDPTLQGNWNGGYPGNNHHLPGNGWQGNGWCMPGASINCSNNGFCGGQINCPAHSVQRPRPVDPVHKTVTRCVRVTRWVRSGRYMRRVTRLICHRVRI